MAKLFKKKKLKHNDVNHMTKDATKDAPNFPKSHIVNWIWNIIIP